MKRFITVLLCMAMAFGNTGVFAAQQTDRQYQAPSMTKDGDEDVTFIVEVEGNPAYVEKSMRTNFDLQNTTSEILDAQAKVMSQIKEEISKDSEQGFVYTALFNGFSINGKRNMLEEIEQLDGVKNVYISQKIPVPEPSVKYAGEMTNINSAYDSGYSGKGQVIAIIDSFLDTSHDFFSEAPESPRYSKSDIDRILKERQLNSKASSANQVYKSAKIPYAFDYASGKADTYSQTSYHGTHVTGIAAGKNGTFPDESKFSGVAYDAQILFMNASTGDYLDSSMILAAMNDAAYLDADVINMSFGIDYYDSATQGIYKASITNAKKCGISVVAAAGNSSRGYEEQTPLTKNPDYSSSGTPAGYEDVTAVASADNTAYYSQYECVKLSDGTGLKFYDAFDNANFTKLIKDDYVEYVYCGIGRKEDFSGKDLTGKIALIDRGENYFSEKSDNAKNAGAIGIVIANTDDEIISISELSLPAAMVSKTTGTIMANASEKKIKYFGEQLEQNKSAKKISSYSSWGVDSSLQLKPEITAPGGNIYSSYPDNKYVYLSGTSMASPYITGVYALAREFYKTNPFADKYNGLENENLVNLIENISMNSADIMRTNSGLIYSPRVQGAGLVNVKNMFGAKVMLTGDSGKAKLSLGEISDSFEVPFTVTNISKETVTFDDISVELVTDGYYEDNGEYYVGDSVKVEPDSVTFADETITIEPGGEYTFTAVISLNKEFLEANKKIFENGFFIDGFVILKNTDDENSASMPFTGFYGDWYSAPIFDSTVYDEGGSTLTMYGYPYSSGTYMQAYINDNSYYLVGRNMIDRSIADKKYISYSNESDLTLALSLTNYRAASNFAFVIFDKNDKLCYVQAANSLVNKFHETTYKFNKTQMSKLEEGEYKLFVYAAANGSSEYNDVLMLPLVIDNTPPEIVSADYNEETKELTVSVKDNHYVNYLYVGYDDDYTVMPVTDSDITDGIVTKTVDLSGVKDLDSVVIQTEDYAFNYTISDLSTLTDKLGIEISDYKALDGYTSLKFILRNNTDADISRDVIIAFYDKNSKLTATSLKKNYLLKKGENELSFSMLSDTRYAAALKVFVWDENLKPADSVKYFSMVSGN